MNAVEITLPKISCEKSVLFAVLEGICNSILCNRRHTNDKITSMIFPYPFNHLSYGRLENDSLIQTIRIKLSDALNLINKKRNFTLRMEFFYNIEKSKQKGPISWFQSSANISICWERWKIPISIHIYDRLSSSSQSKLSCEEINTELIKLDKNRLENCLLTVIRQGIYVMSEYDHFPPDLRKCTFEIQLQTNDSPALEIWNGIKSALPQFSLSSVGNFSPFQ